MTRARGLLLFAAKFGSRTPQNDLGSILTRFFFPVKALIEISKNINFLLPVEYSGAVEYSTSLGHPQKIATFLTKKVPNSLESPENELRGRATVQNASPGSVNTKNRSQINSGRI